MIKPGHTAQLLEESEKKFRLLYEEAPLAYQSLDANGCLVDVNPAWCSMLGYAREEVLGRWFGDFLIPEQQELFRGRFCQFKNVGRVQDAEFEMVRKDGSHLIIAANGRIGHDENGNFRQTHCILTDITLKKKAEQELREGAQFYKALFEQNPEIMLLTDPNSGAIIHANPAACAFYGYSLEQMTQMNIHHDLADVPPDGTGPAGLKHRLASGICRDVEIFSGPIEVNRQRLNYVLIHDVTQQKAAEAENRRVNAALNERLIALSQPMTVMGRVQFEDLFNLEDIQAIQDAFARATGVASIITSPDGQPITRPSHFCYLCNEIIRNTHTGLANCMHSDAVIGSPRTDGPTARPCLSAGLLDAGASIMAGDHHIANWLIGQVLDSEADLDQMTGYAYEIGVDPAVYRAALNQTPKMPQEQFQQVSQALYLIAAQLSKLAAQNIQQAQVIRDREQAQIKLARANRLYAVISGISQASVRVTSAQELYEQTCDILIQAGQFKLAWIGLFEPASQQLRPVRWAGEEAGYLSNIVVRTDPSPEGQGPAGTAFRERRVICLNQIDTDPRFTVWRDQAVQRGYRSLASLPLLIEQQAVGVVTVYSAEAGFFNEEENCLLEEISASISFALEAIEKEERRRAAETALQESEERYRRLFSSGNDAVFVYPLEADSRPGNFSEVNPIACERLGYSAEELLQRSVADIADPTNITRAIENLAQGKSMLVEVTHKTKDGRELPMEINARGFEYQGRRYALAIARDISERKLAEKRIQAQLERLSALRAIDQAINMKFPLPAIMEVILTQALDQLNVQAADILFYQPETGQLRFGYGKGFSTSLVKGTQMAVPGASIGLALLDQEWANQRLLSAALRQDLLQAEGFTGYHAVPIVANGIVMGQLEIFRKGPLQEGKDWFDYLETLSGQTAIAIEDARLVDTLRKSNQELIKAYDETIAGWSRALDLRDRETEGHSQRVTDMALQLAQLMGLSEAEQVHIRRGALLHDIGKMGIPDRILLKPDQLTPEEWQIMKRHPQYAVDLLSPIAFLRPALDIPYAHHEKWGGSGYPRGLKGEEIPLSARIFAIVDVWDALLSDRTYRRGWPAAEVLAFLEEQSGKHFDPQITAVFVQHLKAGQKANRSVIRG